MALHHEACATEKVECEDERFLQQFDAEVIVPDAVARPLVWSSQLFLGVSIACAVRGFWDLSACLLTVWFTSTNFWRAPRFSSWRRPADWIAVTVTFVYASVLAKTSVIAEAWTNLWFAGLAFLILCFTVNESLLNYRLGTLKPGAFWHSFWSARGITITEVGTFERHKAFQANVWRHFCCVHVWGAVLAFILILAGLP